MAIWDTIKNTYSSFLSQKDGASGVSGTPSRSSNTSSGNTYGSWLQNLIGNRQNTIHILGVAAHLDIRILAGSRQCTGFGTSANAAIRANLSSANNFLITANIVRSLENAARKRIRLHVDIVAHG